jgi:hypothetical protein
MSVPHDADRDLAAEYGVSGILVRKLRNEQLGAGRDYGLNPLHYTTEGKAMMHHLLTSTEQTLTVVRIWPNPTKISVQVHGRPAPVLVVVRSSKKIKRGGRLACRVSAGVVTPSEPRLRPQR